jgi:iron complex outermembrane receptor protein
MNGRAGFVRQDSRKDCPPYAGTNPKTQPRYWRYPTWEKNSLYAIGRQSLGATACSSFAAYYDTYKNTLESFDATPIPRRPAPFRSPAITTTTLGEEQANSRRVSARIILQKPPFNINAMCNREHNEGQSESDFSDATISVGLEDTILLHASWTLAAGVGYERR